ncbi:MAG: hypothetical protein K6G54_02870 [Oscillospiraceae bacterium]|nr:hypothetical protein [Oscillospiraceae bacterium]
MARNYNRRDHQQTVSGNLAYDYGRLEREERRRREREAQQAERQVEAQRNAARREAEPLPRRREGIRVSPVAVLGFATVAAMVVLLLMSYAQLTMISKTVVAQQKTLATLEEEHVKLVSRYERTFDLSAIKEAAESAGMAKPSASQIYYIDLSEPDNVVLYRQEGDGLLDRVTALIGRNVASVVEYFN